MSGYATKADLEALRIRCGYSEELSAALDELSRKLDAALTAEIARVAARILLEGRKP